MLFLLAMVLPAATVMPSSASQQASPPSDPNKYMHEIVDHELKAEETDHTHWMYRLHKEDDKGAQDRQVIETKEGYYLDYTQPESPLQSGVLHSMDRSFATVTPCTQMASGFLNWSVYHPYNIY